MTSEAGVSGLEVGAPWIHSCLSLSESRVVGLDSTGFASAIPGFYSKLEHFGEHTCCWFASGVSDFSSCWTEQAIIEVSVAPSLRPALPSKS